jgi:hypothetical protein
VCILKTDAWFTLLGITSRKYNYYGAIAGYAIFDMLPWHWHDYSKNRDGLSIRLNACWCKEKLYLSDNF